jgi:hypothetical protein
MWKFLTNIVAHATGVEPTRLGNSHFSLCKINLSTVDLAVQEEGVCSEQKTRQSKDNSKCG